MMGKDERIEELESEIEALKEKLKKQQKEHDKSEVWFQQVIDQLPNPLFIKDENSRFVNVNVAFENFVNLSKSELLGKGDNDFFPEKEAQEFLRVDTEILTNGGINWNEESLTVGGEKHELLTSKVRVFDANKNKFLLGVITDITDKENQHVILRKKKEELEQERSNNQTLLKEIHHRVKNNLQVVSSLLNLQMQVFEDEVVKKAFDNCKNRIFAMAHVHEILYRTQNFSNLNFSTYINSLIHKLKRIYQVENNIHFQLDLVNVFLKVDYAIPLGMAVNEIVINSIKHGKVEGEDLVIFVRFYFKDGTYYLELGDNGRGSMPSLDGGKQSFGTELIKLYCNQIQANLELSKAENTSFYTISFEKEMARTQTTIDYSAKLA